MKKPLFTVLALFCIGSATAYIRSTIENQTFHPNGNIKSEVVEINGVKTTKYYDESGTLISQGELKNGVEQGMWKYFDKDGNVNVMFGKVSFTEEALNENFKALFDQINKVKPNSVKGAYIKKITVSTTMGPGINVTVE